MHLTWSCQQILIILELKYTQQGIDLSFNTQVSVPQSLYIQQSWTSNSSFSYSNVIMHSYSQFGEKKAKKQQKILTKEHLIAFQKCKTALIATQHHFLHISFVQLMRTVT